MPCVLELSREAGTDVASANHADFHGLSRSEWLSKNIDGVARRFGQAGAVCVAAPPSHGAQRPAPNVRFGSITVIRPRPANVWFAPRADIRRGLLFWG